MTNSYQNIAALIDRDGVINELPKYKLGNEVEFITSPEDLILINGAAEGIKLLNQNNIKTIIISNQPQVARGILKTEEVITINNKLKELLNNKGAEIDAIYFCPHHPIKGINEFKIECECRKPKPGMIIKAKEEFKLDLKNSFVIGDRSSDIKAGNLAGCKTIAVKTGYGFNDEFKDATADFIVSDLLEAAKLIISEGKWK